ncbi:MAG TPA: MmgE/PrpD family protein [Gemmatimonadaceae bacterium]|nr:MmgE/PrpD family protein [Gemmatimonadaceae bacterium]
MEHRVSVVEQLATFVAGTSYEDLSRNARLQLKIRILDTLGCAIGAIGADSVRKVRAYAKAWCADGPCTLIGGGHSAPDRAALVNGALGRYLDFNDSYLAPRETCHPSDNFAAVLAAAELANADGLTLLTSLAVAYQVQCRLSDVAPVRNRGFDHTTHLAYSAAAGSARALGMDAEHTAHAIAISGAALNALRVTRTGALSNWKGLAAPFAGSAALEATLLARRGITGPLGVFEGNKGFYDAVAGPFDIDWEAEDLERITATILKKFNAEIHSQSAIQAALDLRQLGGFSLEQIATIQVEIFDVGYHIIGGGDEGDKTLVMTKEDADHSLPYLVSVALIDGAVMPEQYDPERIQRDDVQDLLCRVFIHQNRNYSRRFPEEMLSRVLVTLRDGRQVELERRDYPGFSTNPMSWSDVHEKFVELAAPHASAMDLTELASAVENLENIRVRELTQILSRVNAPTQSSTIAAA